MLSLWTLMWGQVRIIGVVGGPPEVRYLPGGDKVVANVNVGVRPLRRSSTPVQLVWLRVEFWGIEVRLRSFFFFPLGAL
jgi:single-stranded DNA-binding protein